MRRNGTSRKEYAFTTSTLGTATNTKTYSYDDATWGDLLTSINGSAVTYDAIGNPLTYGGATLTWVNGRRLASFTNTDNSITYTYNDEGIRLSKTVNGVTHTYQLNGTQIVSETWGVHTIFYIYDETGMIAGMRYRSSSYAEGVFDEYLFDKNLQGDVVAIYNVSGTKLVSYLYDAWGEVTTTYHNGGVNTSAKYNPFKYRGYYYDEEIGLYYLNSRYYDPAVGRFISADGYVSTGQGIIGNNMFAYCGNNPIMGYDPMGKWTFSIGYSISAFAFAGFTYSFSISFDSFGNIAFQTTKADVFSEGVTLGAASIGVSKSYSFTSLETVNDLNGQSINVGASGIPIYGPITVGGDAIFSSEEWVGGDISIGAGIGTDVHIIASTTDTHFKINIIETVKTIWNNFISWIGG